MKYLNFEGRKIKFDDINIILINEQRWIGGPLGYFLTVFTKKGSYNALRYENKETLKRRLKKFYELLNEEGVNNFAILDNEYVLNIDNVESFEHLQNLAGSSLVQVSFDNEEVFDLYESYNKAHAKQMLNSYNQQQAKYLNTFNL